MEEQNAKFSQNAQQHLRYGSRIVEATLQRVERLKSLDKNGKQLRIRHPRGCAMDFMLPDEDIMPEGDVYLR